MAIKPGYKTFTFDGQNSGTYGAYITGSAVYNAPERDVEMIKIPGRNGAFVQDNGRFENIEVTYPAGIYADSQEDFAKALSDLRNMLASRKGYCRLTDEYNPEEYRMAVYKSGLDVDPVAFQRAGEFTITFDCKPQRYLTSGEEASVYSNNDTITNPTLFDAEPLLAVKGYGKIKFNGYEVDLENVVLGDVLIKNGESNINVSNLSYYINVDLSALNNLDTITFSPMSVVWQISSSGNEIRTSSVISNYGIPGSVVSRLDGAVKTPRYLITIPELTFQKHMSTTYTNTIEIGGTRQGGATYTARLDFSIDYNSASTITFGFAFVYSSAQIKTDKKVLSYGEITGYSTKSQLGDPTYIDCELGNAYKIENDNYISLNQNVDLGSELPKLAPGNNTINIDNTITELKITPHWWKV